VIAALFAVAGACLMGSALAIGDPVNFCIGAVIVAGVIAALTHDGLADD
jgi:hypothetical protein